jgi:hypothetical protein
MVNILAVITGRGIGAESHGKQAWAFSNYFLYAVE